MKIVVKAPCAGSIWLQTTTIGQHVSTGETLLIEESMKLEIPVEAPRAGTVIWLADAGVSVSQDDQVAIIETTP